MSAAQAYAGCDPATTVRTILTSTAGQNSTTTPADKLRALMRSSSQGWLIAAATGVRVDHPQMAAAVITVATDPAAAADLVQQACDRLDLPSSDVTVLLLNDTATDFFSQTGQGRHLGGRLRQLHREPSVHVLARNPIRTELVLEALSPAGDLTRNQR